MLKLSAQCYFKLDTESSFFAPESDQKTAMKSIEILNIEHPRDAPEFYSGVVTRNIRKKAKPRDS
jgi:hypothetical protein